MPETALIYIFSDASFDPRSKRGFTGFLVVEQGAVATALSNIDATARQVELKLVLDTNCTRLELVSVIFVLEVAKSRKLKNIEIFTDCMTVVDLPKRRERLEAVDFKSKSTGTYLSNADLYRRFFELMDEVQAQITWIKGHKVKREKTDMDQIFALVDRTVRRALRESDDEMAGF